MSLVCSICGKDACCSIQHISKGVCILEYRCKSHMALSKPEERVRKREILGVKNGGSHRIEHVQC